MTAATAIINAPQYKPRDIIEADLTSILHVTETTATLRRCVVVETHAGNARMVLVFAAWGAYHSVKACCCIEPADDWAVPFAGWVQKSTHFSLENVVDAPLSLPGSVVGRVPYGDPDMMDALSAVIARADLEGKTKRIR